MDFRWIYSIGNTMPRIARYGILFCLTFMTISVHAQSTVIPLWPQGAPGSEDWTQEERESRNPGDGTRVIRNVTEPTLIAYFPEPALANGSAVIVAPGGAFLFLTIDNEGTDVARWLNARGIAVFVLKYRLVPTATEDTAFWQQVMTFLDGDSEGREINQEIKALAVADGLQAVKIVRSRAEEWGIIPHKIGFLGFSAGAMVTLGVATGYNVERRPDFAAPIYGPSVDAAVIPADAPPLFIVAAADDPLLPATGSANLYSAWTDAGHLAELHIYAEGGHGFGMKQQHLPIDGWIERFGEWIQSEGYSENRPPVPNEELSGLLRSDVSSESGRVESLSITVGDGGTGPYKAVLAGDPGLPTHTIYRPLDLDAFGPNNRLPVVAWANGGCRNSSGEFRNFLSEIASHGFLVVAIGPAGSSAVLGSEDQIGGSQSSQLLDGVDWAVSENNREISEYYRKIDTSKIAVMGQSCGGLQALEVSPDQRVTTTVLWNSGVLNESPPESIRMNLPEVSKEILQRLHAPIAYFIGGSTDIAYENGADDFARIQQIPALFANRDVGHYPATYREPNGGAFAMAGVAWLKWQLKGDETAAKMFVGDSCGLCQDADWTLEKKNIR